LLTLDVTFKPGTPGNEFAVAIERIEGSIRSRFPNVKRIYIEAKQVVAAAHGEGG
jgi:hypothetical protein